jgi:hypothetical protein
MFAYSLGTEYPGAPYFALLYTVEPMPNLQLSMTKNIKL